MHANLSFVLYTVCLFILPGPFLTCVNTVMYLNSQNFPRAEAVKYYTFNWTLNLEYWKLLRMRGLPCLIDVLSMHSTNWTNFVKFYHRKVLLNGYHFTLAFYSQTQDVSLSTAAPSPQEKPWEGRECKQAIKRRNHPVPRNKQHHSKEMLTLRFRPPTRKLEPN